MKILVFYSGGKDSQAALISTVKKYGAKNVEAVFFDTKWEHPETLDFIRETTGKLGVPLKVLTSHLYDGFEDMVRKKKQFPNLLKQFCTEDLKSRPSIKYILGHKENLIIIEGIRKDESQRRSKYQPECMYFKHYFQPLDNGKFLTFKQREVKAWCKTYNADLIRPVFDWTATQVIDYILENGQKPHPAYYKGFERVSCWACIQMKHKDVRLTMKHYPKEWEQLKELEKEVGHSFFPSSKYIPEYAMTGKTSNGNTFATIEDVEKYLKDKNGTLDMFEEMNYGCQSVYRLCD